MALCSTLLTFALQLTLCLSVGCASSTFYCDEGEVTNVIDDDFYFVTRRNGSRLYDAGVDCGVENRIVGRYLVELLEADDSHGRIRLEAQTVANQFRSSHPFLRSVVTGLESVRLTFTAARFGRPRGRGFTVRVRRFAGCPPGWTQIGGGCYGAPLAARHLDFTKAQDACKSMKSNLLLATGSLDLSDLKRQLPTELAEFAWIGIFDASCVGEGRRVWLNRKNLSSSVNLSCSSGRNPANSCNSDELCGAFASDSPTNATVLMTNCQQARKYICYFHVGESSELYTVPQCETSKPSTDWSESWRWVFVVAMLTVPTLALLLLLGKYRSRVANVYNPGDLIVTVHDAPLFTDASRVTDK